MKFNKEYEGKCVVMVRGKVIFSSGSITRVIKESKKYSPQEVSIASVPKGNKVLIL